MWGKLFCKKVSPAPLSKNFNLGKGFLAKRVPRFSLDHVPQPIIGDVERVFLQ